MTGRRPPRLALALLALLASVPVVAAAARGVRRGADPVIETVATGLVNPRGMAFGPDGALYVAEAGRYGSAKVRAGADKVQYHFGRTARIMRLDPSGTLSTLADGLPSVHWGDDTYGVAGVAFVGSDLYALMGTGGRDVGDPAYDNLVLRVAPDGQTQPIADLTTYNLQQPPRARLLDPKRTDVEGGVPFGLTALDGKLYATDGNQETVTEIGLDGSLRRLLEYPASDHVLTGLAPGPDGALYVCEFGPGPHGPGSAHITRLTLDGQASTAWDGLDTAISVAFGPDGSMYAVEFSAGTRIANAGRVLRRTPDGAVTVLASDLNFPTAIAVGPDGNLYVAVSGHRSEDGSGQILRLSPLPPAD
jgi:hypothetical protein